LTLRITAQPGEIPEGSSARFSANVVLEDDTLLSLAPEDFSWRVIAGPAGSISRLGLADVPAVFAHTNLVVSAANASLSGTLSVAVLDLNFDDFGSYRGDGLPDDWQVSFFGRDNPEASPRADPDKDGLDNAAELAAGTSPVNADSDEDGIGDARDGNPAGTRSPVRTSATYSLAPEALDAGGGHALGGELVLIATAGFFGGTGTALAGALRFEHGFAPSLSGSLPAPDLRLAVIDSPDPARTGEAFTYEITLSNRGPGDATQIVITNRLPPGVVLVSASAAEATWTETARGVVIGRVPGLAAGASIEARLLVIPADAGEVVNETAAFALETDLNPRDNVVETQTTVLARTPSAPELAGFALVGGRFQMEIRGWPGETWRIQASSDLIDWITLATKALPPAGILQFIDPGTPDHAARFYRVVAP
jgi:uncharacterized repeat protein (TIGR01451 family)